jgi:nijmegen breakage syndrome protein 1
VHFSWYADGILSDSCSFTWVPINLTFNNPTKEEKLIFSTHCEAFGPLDIKLISHYEQGITTHVVTKKRNTPKGLQALVDGKYIVNPDSFLKALTASTIPMGEERKSPLEEDWETNFPDPSKYLPDRAGEPTERDASAYAPNSSRQDMFEGYTFIFYDKKQYESLSPVLMQGGAEAKYREVIPNKTNVLDFVGYVKGEAGEKGLGSFQDGSEGRGVVVVRFSTKGLDSEWYAGFHTDVSLQLDHRLVEQNEFLDAILAVDASMLRRPLEFAQSGVVAPPPTASKSPEPFSTDLLTNYRQRDDLSNSSKHRASSHSSSDEYRTARACRGAISKNCHYSIHCF